MYTVYCKTIPFDFFFFQVSGEQILGFFSQVGEIKYVRMGGEGIGEARCAYVEFSDQRSVATALTYNGVMFQGSPIR